MKGGEAHEQQCGGGCNTVFLAVRRNLSIEGAKMSRIRLFFVILSLGCSAEKDKHMTSRDADKIDGIEQGAIRGQDKRGFELNDTEYICTVYVFANRSERTLSQTESARIKMALDEQERKSPVKGVTNGRSKWNYPDSYFEFRKNGAETIRYSLWYGEEPFVIEVKIGSDNPERVFFGDDELRTKVRDISNSIRDGKKR